MIKQQGSAMLEGLIAILVLVIGILGIIGFQASLLAHSGNAQLRLRATLLGQELVALVNADNLNAACYVVPVNSQSGCGSTVARSYTTNWVSEVTSILPGASDNLPTATLANDGTFTVNIMWKRPQEATLHNYTVTTQIGT